MTAPRTVAQKARDLLNDARTLRHPDGVGGARLSVTHEAANLAIRELERRDAASPDEAARPLAQSTYPAMMFADPLALIEADCGTERPSPYRPAVGEAFTVVKWLARKDLSYIDDILTSTFVDEHVVICEQRCAWRRGVRALRLSFSDVKLRPLSREYVQAEQARLNESQA